MTERPAAKQRMYTLINPDPLRRVTIRWLAEKSGSSRTVIGDLRTGRRTVVPERVATNIERALQVQPGDLFRYADRLSWERRP